MALLKLSTFPNEILRKKAEEVTVYDQVLIRLVRDMAETMYTNDGVGLAAPQVGVSKRLFICDPHPAEEQGKDLWVFVNPVIVERSGKIEYKEGCLSVPGVSATVLRSKQVKVQAYNEKGEPFEVLISDLFAVCAQHEIDHLDGVLFFDYLDPYARKMLIEEYTKIKKM